jgi:isochorismate hydrolase
MSHARCVPSSRLVFPSPTTHKRQRVAPQAVRAVAMATSAQTPHPRLDPSRVVLFVCDVREKFAPVIHGFANCVYVAQLMLRASELLGFTAIITEQVPDKLGKTVHALQAIIKDNEDHVYAKTKFSMVNPETSDHLDSLEEVIAKPQALLCGLETHVCVSQTAFDLLERGWEVFILVDGVSSQRTSDRSVALRRMENAGCVLTTSEAALFELVGDARHDKFREVSKLVREPRPEVPLPVP